MIVVVGLGNPGKKFEKTRHNVGFEFLDYLKEKKGFSDWAMKNYFLAKISVGNILEKKVLLIKPQIFMNNSGKTAKRISGKLGVETENFWVLHDDTALEFGRIKMSKNHSSAGHKGVQSIVDKMGSKNFLRFRVGIGMPKGKNKKIFVLKRFNQREGKLLTAAKEKFILILEMALEQGIQRAMTECNKK